MLEVADVFRRHGAAYRARCGARLWPVQLRAMRDIAACRTAYFGGHLKQCDHCGRQVYAYHSCRNRHCPKCHGHQTDRWLAQQQARLLPCPYFLLTFTLPAELRPLALANQKQVYGLLMRSAAAALQKLAWDPRYLGGRLGCLAVLHTGTRTMLYHPHVHMLVTGGGLSADRNLWLPLKHPNYLVPGEALALIFRAKFCAALHRAGLLAKVPPQVWKKNWVVDCKPAGSGRQVLNYLARYIFRVAISNSRLELLDNHQVTFRYRDNRTQQLHHLTLTGEEFIRRFLLHLLPPGCAKVRYYGLYSPACRPQLELARTQLDLAAADLPDAPLPAPLTPAAPARCPHCQLGQWLLLTVLPPQREPP